MPLVDLSGAQSGAIVKVKDHIVSAWHKSHSIDDPVRDSHSADVPFSRVSSHKILPGVPSMTNFPDRFQQQVIPAPPPAVMPGRVIQETVRRSFPSGRVVTFTRREETVMDQTGTLRTSIVNETSPPLDDGLVPRDINDIAECSYCSRLVVASLHAVLCQDECKKVICQECIDQKYSDSIGQYVCRKCAYKATTPWIIRLLQWPFRK